MAYHGLLVDSKQADYLSAINAKACKACQNAALAQKCSLCLKLSDSYAMTVLITSSWASDSESGADEEPSNDYGALLYIVVMV